VKRCELCQREASNLTIFELQVGPGVLPRLPHQWVCREHAAKSWADVVFRGGRPVGQRSIATTLDLELFKKTWDDFACRLPPEFVTELCSREDGVVLSLGPSKLTELEGEQLRQAAVEQGKTVEQQALTVGVEVMTPEEAAREIARMN